ncbi:MAG: hypothetical protein LN414_06410 [Candidatus Thermoplasmatota archaeon]|nr:hypothetical protein [Candidatus Thermoplasmatota archaeon]
MTNGGERIIQVDVKKYYETLLARVQKIVDSDYHASAALIELYQGLPAAVDAYTMPNGAVIGLVKLNSSENRVEVFSGEYSAVKGELRNRTFDYMLPVFPSHPTSEDEINATIKCHIEERLREIDFAQYLKDVVLGIVNIEGQISEISKTNPWLSKQFGELTTMLSDTRKLAEGLSKSATESRDRLRYESYEEMVEFLESFDPNSSPQILDSIDLEKVRTFMTEFIRSYRATIDAKSLAKEAFPPFYADYPYHVELNLLPNKNVAIFFSKATEGMRFTDRQLGFNEFENEVRDKSFTYALGLPNCVTFEKTGAVHQAQVQAQIDLERHDIQLGLEDIPASLDEIEKQIIKIKKSNPWLEQNLSELLKTLETCTKPVTKLLSRIEKRRNAGIVLRSYVNQFDSSISVFPSSGDPGLAAPVYEDVETAQVATPQGAFVPAIAVAPATPPPPVAAPPPSFGTGSASGEYELQIPMAGAEAPAVPSMEATDMGTGDMNEVKSMLYTFERKLADYEKRLHYIDKYTEMIQRQQNKKFKAQKELITLESRKGKWLGVGIGVSALTISVILVLVTYEELLDLISTLLGG